MTVRHDTEPRVWIVFYRDNAVNHHSATAKEAADYWIKNWKIQSQDRETIYVFEKKDAYIFHVNRPDPQLEEDLYYRSYAQDAQPSSL